MTLFHHSKAMGHLTLQVICVGLLGWAVLCQPSEAEIRQEHFSLSLTLTSDYVYRGLSTNDEEPALQFGLDFEHPSGVFAGLWGSDAELPPFPPATEPRESELDVYVGYAVEISRRWSADLTWVATTYPRSDPIKSYDYEEWIGSLHLRDRATVSIGYSTDVQGFGGAGVSYEGTVRFPLRHAVDLDLGYGYWDLEKVFGEGYGYWGVGLSRPLGRWLFSLDYIDTDSTAKLFFRDSAGERVAFGITFHVF